MRRIFLSTAAILSLILSSCDSKKSGDNDAISNKSEAAEQPIVSETDISTNVESSASPNTYVVLQDNGQQKTITIDANETVISANNLPVNAQKFVTQNFGNIEFIHAVKEVEQNTTTYNTQLKDGTKIEFTDNGDWIEVKNELGKALPNKFFPENIQKYLQTKYPNINVKSIEMDTKDNEIKVELLETKVDLKFDLNGNFIKID
ncbi:PepSY-like domain-containing protein [Empedobacter brevis]|uniref:PepSY-like domain-containing protein n=1 Tax=Empedobacter brevis TaxID=247 RepID=UPI0039B0A9A7